MGILFLMTSNPARSETFTSLDALIKHYDSGACKECHGKIHEEWSKSFHGRSIVQSLGSLRAFVAALETERKVAPDKGQMLKCLDCHAPIVNDASEAVVQEIVGLVKTAMDDKDEAKKKAARDKLAKLAVDCLGCHRVKGTANALTPPDPKMIYGPKAGQAQHPVQAISVMKSSVMCSQCHALWYAKDGEYLYCTTIFESHQNAYRGLGGTRTCQDCHMKEGSHSFPGAHDQELVKAGVQLALDAVGYRHLTEGKYLPRAVVNVDISNRAGHRIPDG
jgi:hypothetical protein